MKGPDIQRLYYSSRQVCEMASIDMKTLAEWETVFPKIKPVRHKSGKKLYRPSDLETVLLIRKMKKKRIDDAKIQILLESNLIDEMSSQARIKQPKKQMIPEIKKRLNDILRVIDQDED